MSRKIPDSKVTACRLSTSVEQRVQAVAAELSRRAIGAPVTISVAIGLLVSRGLDALEPELGISSKPAAKKSKAS
jgi:hypothetical protein